MSVVYSVEYSKKSVKALAKLDTSTASMILSWVEKNLVGCSDPRTHGKALTGDMSDYWRYRVGSYRLIAKIRDSVITITIVNIGHRREIYEH